MATFKGLTIRGPNSSFMLRVHLEKMKSGADFFNQRKFHKVLDEKF